MAEHNHPLPGDVSPIESSPRSFKLHEGHYDPEHQVGHERYGESSSKTKEGVFNSEPRMTKANGKKGVELEHLESVHDKKAKMTRKEKLRRHWKRYWICYLIGGIIFSAIFLPLFFLKIIPALAQLIVDKTALPINGATLNAISDTQVIISLSTSLDVPAGLSVNLDQTLLNLYNADTQGPFQPYTYVSLPAQTLSGHTVVTVVNQTVNVGDRKELRKWLEKTFYNETTDISVRGDTTAWLGALKAPIHLEKTVTIDGLNQLKGVKLDTLRVLLPAEADGTNLRGMITLPNWSKLTIGLGNLTFNAWAGDVVIGSATVYNVMLTPGNNTLPFHGEIFIPTVIANLGKVISSQATALLKGNLELGVSGNSTKVNGEHITYLEDVLNNIKLFTQVPVIQTLGDVLSGVLGGDVTLKGIADLIANLLGNGSLADLLSGGGLADLLTGLNLTSTIKTIQAENLDTTAASKLVAENVVLPVSLETLRRH